MEKLSKNFKIMENRMHTMYQAMREVSENWDDLTSDEQDLMCKMYPFADSFDKVVSDTKEWVDTVSNSARYAIS